MDLFDQPSQNNFNEITMEEIAKILNQCKTDIEDLTKKINNGTIDINEIIHQSEHIHSNMEILICEIHMQKASIKKPAN